LNAPRFLTATGAEWEAVLDRHSVPCSRVRTVADIVADEQMEALGLLASVPHPFIEDLRLVDLPMSRDGVRADELRAPPLLGEHTDEVLAELGVDATAIDDLRQRGVVRRRAVDRRRRTDAPAVRGPGLGTCARLARHPA